MVRFFSILIIFLIATAYESESRPTKRCFGDRICLNNNKYFDKQNNNRIYCDLCEIFLPVLRGYINENKTERISELLVYVCDLTRIEDNVVCNQIINLFKTPVISIIRDSPMNSEELCSLGLECSSDENPFFNWNITLPSNPKPAPMPIPSPKPDSPTLRILHLSDIHIDFEYEPGAIADCGQPLCCRNSSRIKKDANEFDESIYAGYWGDYRNCDVPLWTVENMFEHISKNENFDFIYWTGDLPPHNVWNQSRSDQLNALDRLTELFKKYFPKKITYPTVGNHEASPVNLYPTPSTKDDNITWLYSELAKDWVESGLPSYLASDITKGAFYSVLLAPGVRLISLNMNYCDGGNWWLYINSTDPLNQLDWLVKILQLSENKGEKVHIIGHQPPSSCLNSWSNNYYKIINRYESTVTGQFFGHTHNDEFKLFYDLENVTRPVNVAYLAGSVTTFSFLNPSYRIYTVDGFYENTTFQVLDHDTYYTNLTESNLKKSIEWTKEYSAKDAFDMKNLLPVEWDYLLNKMLNDVNGTLVDKLYAFYNKKSDSATSCDTECRRSLLCGFKQARSVDYIKC